MYKADSYAILSKVDIATLRHEMDMAKSKLDYYHAYLNGEYTEPPETVDYELGFNGVKSCEQYIIEVERRLGLYTSHVSKMLLRWRHKNIQTKGFQASFAELEDVPVSKIVKPVLNAKKFRKFKQANKKGRVA